MRALTAAVAVAIIIAILAGAAYWLLMKGGPGSLGGLVSNAVKVEGVELYAVSSKSTPELTFIEAVIKYEVTAPNIVSLDVGGGELNITVNGVKLLTATIPPQKVSGGTHEFRVTGYLENEGISKWWVTHLRNGEETNVSVDGYVSIGLAGTYVHVPVHDSARIKTHIFPIHEKLNRELSLGPLGSVTIKEATITLTGINEEATNLKAVISVENDLKIPLVLGDVAYSVTLPDGTKVAEGYVKGLTTIPPGSSRELTVPVKIDNDAIPKLWYFIVQGRGKANLTINVWFRLSYGSRTLDILKNHPIRIEVTVNAPIMKFK